MAKKSDALARLLDIMDQLRIKCPWDRQQTMLSLRSNTIEECFELTDAILEGGMPDIKKELGDLLLHIVFYAKIAEETGDFDIADVADSISDKLIYRHPHVFGAVDVENAEQVSQNWEELKQTEKDGNETILAGVAKGMPALPKACRIQQKVAAVGFDWKQKEDVWDKVKEEVAEVQREIDSKNEVELEKEFGDLLFSIVNAARLYGINPDTALDRTNRKFIDRFTYLEHQTIKKGRSLRNMTLEEMDKYWDEAKGLE